MAKTTLVQHTKYGYWYFSPTPKVDYAKYYSDEKPDCIKNQIEDLDWWNLMYDDRLDIMESHKGNIIDVGCGAGYFVKRATGKGWTAEGIDINHQSVQYAQSMGADCEIMPIENVLSDFYDAVHCSEVLEHVPDPVVFLKECNRIMRKDGIICIVVPNDFNQLQKILEPVYGQYWVSYPWHINYFSFDSLTKLVEDVGFRVVHISTMFPMEWFALCGFFYIGNDKIGRQVHIVRKQFDAQINRKAIYGNLASFGLGREVVLYATKT
jgi:SAM-dependent methyltransferase